jgi:hypothetical protein
MLPPYQVTQVAEVALPSAADGYDFLFSAAVSWRPVAEHVGRADDTWSSFAASSVVSRALEVVRYEEPTRVSFAQLLLDGELGVPLVDRSGRVEARAADVTLALSPADRDRLRRLADLRKDEALWEHERQHERNKRDYLGGDVLKSTGSAVVWWLARHEDEIEQAVDMIGPLARVTAAANDEEVPELFRDLLVPPTGATGTATVGGPPWGGFGPAGGAGVFDREEEVGVAERLRLLLTAVGLKPDMDAYTVFVHRVVRDLEAAELNEAAAEIRRAFPWTATGTGSGAGYGDEGPYMDETGEPQGGPESGPGWQEPQDSDEADPAPPHFWGPEPAAPPEEATSGGPAQ